MERRLWGRRLLVPLVMALAVGTAACGGSAGGATAEIASADGSGSADVKDAADRKVDAEKAGLEFAKCMREHGVDIPDPQSGGDGFIMVGPGPGAGEVSAEATTGDPVAGTAIPEEFREADKACRHLLDDLIQDGGPPMDAEAQDRALKFAKCMREHGIDMPDPQFSSGSGGGFSIQIGRADGGEGGGIDPRSQAFQDAQKECGSVFGPEGGPGGPGGPGGGTFSSSARAVAS